VATGRCEIKPKSFVTKIIVENGRATSVRWRDSNGEEYEESAEVVVLSAGTVESPRLWMNSGLPDPHNVVGRFFSTHLQDLVIGFFEREVRQDVGQVTMARADFPGYGCIWGQGLEPQSYVNVVGGVGRGMMTDPTTGPWDSRGRMWGEEVRKWHDLYAHALPLIVSVDDEEHPESRITLDHDYGDDEHGTVPLISYHETPASTQRREWLAAKGTEILKAAGAYHVHRPDLSTFVTHPMGTMRMGNDPKSSVVDAACESHAVERLFVADNSVFANGLGGPNPTLTCHALAVRTADKVLQRYLS
jgi:choline dehydrogenase-like flavoprotein